MPQWINHHWFRQWLVPWLVPSHCQNQCWNIVNWTLRNKLQWNLNRNSYIFIQENSFKNKEMAASLSQPQCVMLQWIVYCYGPWKSPLITVMPCEWQWIYFGRLFYILVMIMLVHSKENIKVSLSLKTTSCYDANFVITGTTSTDKNWHHYIPLVSM